MALFSRILNPLTFMRRAAEPSPAQLEVATRKAAEWMDTAMLYLPNPDDVLRKLGRADGISRLQLYRQLLSDDRVGSDIESLKSGVKSLDWQIESSDKVPAEVLEHVKENFTNLKVIDILGEMVDAILYGMQPFERTWEPDGRRVWLKALVGKPAEWFIYDIDGEPRFLQKGIPAGTLLSTWPKQFQIARHDSNFQNPYGFPILSRIYWAVVFKKAALKYNITFLEKWGIPHAIARVQDMSDKAKVQEWMRKLHGLIRDSVAVVTDTGKVELLEPKNSGASADLYARLIEWANDAITTVILGHQGATKSTAGSLGGAEKMAAKSSEDRIWAAKALAKQEFDLLIKDMVALNFGEEVPCPTFAFYEKEDIDVTRSERDKNVLDADKTLRLSDQYLERAYGFQPGDIVRVKEVEPKNAEEEEPPRSSGFRQARAYFAKALGRPTEEEVRDEQAVLTSLLDSLPPAELQEFSEAACKPLLDLIGNAQGYDEARAGLKDLYGDLDTDKFEAALQQVLFLSESFGRSKREA